MKKTHTLLAAYGIAVAAATSTASFADFNLGNLKAIADKVKAYQEAAKQKPQTLPSMPNEDVPGQVENFPQGTSDEVDEASIKAAREKWDVLGVRMGMSLDEALARLKAHNQSLKIYDKRTIKYEDADNKDHIYVAYLISGMRPNTPEARVKQIENVYLKISMPPRQRVISIIRVIYYPKNQAPTMSTTITALRNKYGNQPEKGSGDLGNYGNRVLLWQIGKRPERNLACPHSPPLAQPLLKDKRCEMIMLTANVQPFKDNPDVIDSLTTSLSDFMMNNRDFESAKQYFENAREARKQMELDAAKKKAAPIL